MSKCLFPCLLLLLSNFWTFGQDCSSASLANGTYLDANEIRTLIPASGSLFWDGSDAQFRIQGQDGGFATIFAHALWLGAEDPGGNLAIAAPTYGASGGNKDYYPGPVAEDGSVYPDACVDFDRAWSVFRYEIEAHLADFADNGVIDNPSSAILAWPGNGNPEFFTQNGFELPTTSQGAAPFFDLNADGIYQPLQGDYPFVPQSTTLPDQIVWSVFNTMAGPANNSGSPLAMQVEVQLLAWAFNCTDNLTLSNTVFTSYKVISRSTEAYANLRLGLWTDFDLGCYEDDYVGSAPDLNTFFVYNQNEIDDLCSTNVQNIGDNPPVQAITVLSQPLDGFMYMFNSAVGSGFPIPAGLVTPQTPGEIYDFLNNRFTDGTPLTFGGTGYDPDSDEVVSHAWSGDPNVAGSWSETVLAFPPQDRRGLGTVAGPESFLPGQVYTVDVAYSYHRAPGAGHLGNVTNMYEGVAQLRNDYDGGFAGTCAQQLICAEDCIWSGDLNADGIANYEDLITLGFELNANGALRGVPYNWTPQNGADWGTMQLLYDADQKHLDANGDGLADQADFALTQDHYNFTRAGYAPVFEYPTGDDFSVTRTDGEPLIDLNPGESMSVRIRLETEVTDLRALSFTLEYDPVYFDEFDPLIEGFLPESMKYYNSQTEGALDYAYYLLDSDEQIVPSTQVFLSLKMLGVQQEALPSDETFVRFRNIRAYLNDGTEVDLGAQDVLFQVNGIPVVNTDEPAWADGVQLYPNPATDRLNWSFGATVPTEYRLLDTRGRTVANGSVSDSGLDIGALPPGVYSLQLILDDKAIVRKVAKQ